MGQAARQAFLDWFAAAVSFHRIAEELEDVPRGSYKAAIPSP